MMMSPVIAKAFASAPADQDTLNHILRAVRTHLGMDVGFISEFREGRRIFRHVETLEGKECIEVGGSDPLEESYCHWIAKGQLPRLMRDPRDHPLTGQFAVTEALPVGAHLSVPIALRDGQIYGTFCCFSFAPDRSLNERDLATMEAFADVAAQLIQISIDRDRARQTKLSKVKQVLRSRAVDIVYQPAIRLDATGVEFVEALARFRSKPYQEPNRWFAIAAEVGLGVELEMLAVETALQGLPQLPAGTLVSINVSPETILSDDLGATLASGPVDRLILEITEHETVANYAALNSALAPLRSRGLRIAVDDTGAGYSSFRHILKIRPDLIKLDMSLVQHIDSDPARRALASALIAFANDIGSELVAEGVETDAELHTLAKLGVKIAQGYLLSEPLLESELNELARISFGPPPAVMRA